MAEMIYFEGEVSDVTLEVIGRVSGPNLLRTYFTIGHDRFFGTVPAKFQLQQGDVVEVVGRRAWRMIEIYVVRNVSRNSNVLPAWPIELLISAVCGACTIAAGFFTWHVARIGATGFVVIYGVFAIFTLISAGFYFVRGRRLRRATGLLKQPAPVMRPWH